MPGIVVFLSVKQIHTGQCELNPQSSSWLTVRYWRRWPCLPSLRHLPYSVTTPLSPSLSLPLSLSGHLWRFKRPFWGTLIGKELWAASRSLWQPVRSPRSYNCMGLNSANNLSEPKLSPYPVKSQMRPPPSRNFEVLWNSK